MSAALVRRVLDHGGDGALAELMRLSGVRCDPDTLLEASNWLSLEEADALWAAGARVTHDPDFARAVGEDTARRTTVLAPVPDATRQDPAHDVGRQLVAIASPLSAVSQPVLAAALPGEAEIVARAWRRASGDHCAWLCGVLRGSAALLGLLAVTVEHRECEALGAERCVYRVRWEVRDTGLPDPARSLLDLSFELATAGPSDEVALRLADAVRLVVDCDVVSVQLWDPASGQLVQRALGGRGELGGGDGTGAITGALAADGLLDGLLACAVTDPIFMTGESAPRALRQRMRASGVSAGVVLPLVAPDGFVGLLGIAAFDRPERLRPSAGLHERLAGIAAQAAVAIQNGRLVDAFAQHALHDSLTGLANRLQFNEILRETVDRAGATGGTLALLFIDLDGFKAVNDSCGHDVGDELLVAVGERLCGYTRGSDTVGRLGGDEFAVLIESAAGLEQLSKRLEAAFATPFEVGGRELTVGASIGAACFPADATTASELLRLADAAMYAIKVTRPAAQRGEHRDG